MGRFYPIRKVDLFSAMSLFLGSCVLMMTYPDMSIPQKSELHYYSGKLGVLSVRTDHNSKSTDQYLAFYDKKTKTILEFSCAYSQAFFGTSDRSCGSKNDFKPYVGKMATIGWYRQDGILGDTNNRLQMVILKSGDKVIHSYEDTMMEVKRRKTTLKYSIFFTALLSVLTYWMLGKLNQ